MSGEETKLQYKALRYIESNFPGSVCFKVEKCSKNGVPDIWYAIPGFPATFAEFKKNEKEDLKPHQKAMIKRMNMAGQRAIEIKSWDMWVKEFTYIRSVLNG